MPAIYHPPGLPPVVVTVKSILSPSAKSLIGSKKVRWLKVNGPVPESEMTKDPLLTAWQPADTAQDACGASASRNAAPAARVHIRALRAGPAGPDAPTAALHADFTPRYASVKPYYGESAPI